jgi:thioredoxin-dependent peroxiredoxin
MTREKVPNVIFRTRVRDESVGGENPFRWQDLTTREIFGGKRVVLFALPGAFTPTCSSTHLPEYDRLYDQIRAHGVDEVICLSVNDAFTMYQWGKHLGIQKVFLLPDGNADFTRLMGMLVKKENLGFGMRSWRYAMVVDDGKIEQMFVEDGFEDDCKLDPFGVSDARNVLAYLQGRDESRQREQGQPQDQPQGQQQGQSQAAPRA